MATVRVIGIGVNKITHVFHINDFHFLSVMSNGG